MAIKATFLLSRLVRTHPFTITWLPIASDLSTSIILIPFGVLHNQQVFINKGQKYKIDWFCPMKNLQSFNY